MQPLRADIEIELQQLERRFAYLLAHTGQEADFSGFQRECERVLGLVPAEGLQQARERIDVMLGRLHGRVRVESPPAPLGG